MKVSQANKILNAIAVLKMELVKGQDFDNAAIIRDMQKHYSDLEMPEEKGNYTNKF